MGRLSTYFVNVLEFSSHMLWFKRANIVLVVVGHKCHNAQPEEYIDVQVAYIKDQKVIATLKEKATKMAIASKAIPTDERMRFVYGQKFIFNHCPEEILAPISKWLHAEDQVGKDHQAIFNPDIVPEDIADLCLDLEQYGPMQLLSNNAAKFKAFDGVITLYDGWLSIFALEDGKVTLPHPKKIGLSPEESRLIRDELNTQLCGAYIISNFMRKMRCWGLPKGSLSRKRMPRFAEAVSAIGDMLTPTLMAKSHRELGLWLFGEEVIFGKDYVDRLKQQLTLADSLRTPAEENQHKASALAIQKNIEDSEFGPSYQELNTLWKEFMGEPEDEQH